MKKQLTILILTKHKKHSIHNSLYTLASELVQHKSIKKVDIASSSILENQLFFDGKDSQVLARSVNPRFSYDSTRNDEGWKAFLVNPKDYDYILMRLPPPINSTFVKKITNIIDKKRIINNPIASQEYGSKSALLKFSNICPPIKLISSLKDLEIFCSKYKTVLKPLNEHGGIGIVKIENNLVIDGDNSYSLQEYWQKNCVKNPQVLAMKFLEGVEHGDKRIVVVNKKSIFSVLRKPAPNGWLCNVSQGGSAEKCEFSKNEEHIVKEISKVLVPKGVVFFAIDTLEENGIRYLSEINCTSVGGIYPASKMYDQNFSKKIVDELVIYMQNQNY